MADDEFLFLREILRNEELARNVADANNESAVALLLHANSPLNIVIMLWRNRTREDSKTAWVAVERIAQQEGMRIHTDKSSGNVSLIQQEAPTGDQP